MTLSRRLKRQNRDKRERPGASERLAPETLARVVSPMKRIFPFNFPGQLGGWLKRGGKT